MSSIIYNKAFEVELSHNFYVTENQFQVNRDLEIIPTNATADLLSTGRMRFIRTGSGFDVFYKSYLDSSTMVPVEKPLVPLSGPQELLFVVRMKQDGAPLYLNITDLDVNSQTYSSGKILLLDKSVSAYPSPGMPPPPPPYVEDLDDSLIDQLRPAIFTYSFLPDNVGFTGAVNITVKDEALNTVFTFTGITPDLATGIYSIPLDFSSEPKGIYHIHAESTGPTTTQHDADIYVDSDLAKENVFGLIRLKFTSASLFYQTCTDKQKFFTFDYAFMNREVLWRYYIVAKDLDSTFFSTYDLTVFDENVSPPPTATFVASNPGTDGQPYGQPDDDISINGLDTVILTSLAPIAYTETARQNMNLYKHLRGSGIVTPTNTKIIDNLPNARVDGVDSDQLGAAQIPPTITKGIAEIFVIV